MFNNFWTVKSALVSAFGATLTSMLNVILDCISSKSLLDTTRWPLKAITKVVRVFYATGADSSGRRRSSGSQGEQLYFRCCSDNLGRAHRFAH